MRVSSWNYFCISLADAFICTVLNEIVIAFILTCVIVLNNTLSTFPTLTLKNASMCIAGFLSRRLGWGGTGESARC